MQKPLQKFFNSIAFTTDAYRIWISEFLTVPYPTFELSVKSIYKLQYYRLFILRRPLFVAQYVMFNLNLTEHELAGEYRTV